MNGMNEYKIAPNEDALPTSAYNPDPCVILTALAWN